MSNDISNTRIHEMSKISIHVRKTFGKKLKVLDKYSQYSRNAFNSGP